MEHIEQGKEEIKNSWFKNHEVNIKGEEGLQVLYWGEKGTNMYRIKYVLSGNNVFISGDIGEAIYTLTCKATLGNIKGFDLRYFTQKLSAHSSERWRFDEKKAKEELRDWYLDAKENGVDDLEDLRSLYQELNMATNEWTLQSHFETAVFSIYENTSVDWFDGEEASMVSGFGKTMPYRFIAYWLGLQMIIEQLEIKEKSA